MENLSKGLKHLKDVVLKQRVYSFSNVKSDNIGSIPWDDVLSKMRHILRGLNVKVIIYAGAIVYPIVSDRFNILREAHSSAMDGNKEVIKTYQRIKQRYFWIKLED